MVHVQLVGIEPRIFDGVGIETIDFEDAELPAPAGALKTRPSLRILELAGSENSAIKIPLFEL